MSASSDLIIKPTHAWARTARVVNGTYNCYRKCRLHAGIEFSLRHNENAAHAAAVANMKDTLWNLPEAWFVERETQYAGLTPRIIVEPMIPTEGLHEYYWWVVHGQPVFAVARCDTDEGPRGSYYTIDFRELQIRRTMEPCPAKMQKPLMWERMVQIAKDISKHVVSGIVSIDLYANDTHVLFQEYTFTRNVCNVPFQPWAIDALMYQMDQQELIRDPEWVTPDFVWRTVNDQSWVFVEKAAKNPVAGSIESSEVKGLWSRAYPSAVDLCLSRFDENEFQQQTCLDKVAAAAGAGTNEAATAPPPEHPGNDSVRSYCVVQVNNELKIHTLRNNHQGNVNSNSVATDCWCLVTNDNCL